MIRAQYTTVPTRASSKPGRSSTLRDEAEKLLGESEKSIQTLTRSALTQIVAHRGASREAPENTLAAFAKAIEIGADMIEFDVRRAADGRLVVSHDPVRKVRMCPPLKTRCA